MNKIKNFLDQTGEIRNGDRLVAVAGVLGLAIMGQVLNIKLYKSRIEGIDKDMRIAELELSNTRLRSCLDEE